MRVLIFLDYMFLVQIYIFIYLFISSFIICANTMDIMPSFSKFRLLEKPCGASAIIRLTSFLLFVDRGLF